MSASSLATGFTASAWLSCARLEIPKTPERYSLRWYGRQDHPKQFASAWGLLAGWGVGCHAHESDLQQLSGHPGPVAIVTDDVGNFGHQGLAIHHLIEDRIVAVPGAIS